MDGVGAGELVVGAVEEVFLVALVVDGVELGWVEEAAGVHDVGGDEVADFLRSVSEIETDVGGTEGAIGRGDLAVRLGVAEAGARGGDDDQRSLAAVLGRGRAGNDFERLDGVHRDLVGEGLRLLVGDGLAVDGERVGGVVAHAVEHSVGVGGDAGRGERDHRADRGGQALERDLGEEIAVDIGVADGSASMRSPLVAVTSTVVLVEAT